MAKDDANRLALRIAREVLGAAHPMTASVEGVTVKVEILPHRGKPIPWPTLPGDRPLPGLSEHRDGPWPLPCTFHCVWGEGSAVDLQARLSFWRGSRRYEGDLTLEVATRPRNRQLVWTNLTQRIHDAQGQPRCSIPVHSALFVREGERYVQPLTKALTHSFKNAGFEEEGATQFRLFHVRLPGGSVDDPARAFENLVQAALLKLTYVTRGESNDVQGTPLIDISAHQRLAAAEPSATSAPPAEPTPTADAPQAQEQVSPQDQVFFDSIEVKNFGSLESFEWTQMGRLNIIIGSNDTGKSLLLKLLYAQARSVEEYTSRLAAADRPTWKDTLAEKMLWTFQPQSGQLGELVRRGTSQMEVWSVIRNEEYAFRLPANAKRTVTDYDELTGQALPQPQLKTLFLPPKEVLTALEAIAAVREQLRSFGFDDTYQDLIRALRSPKVEDVLPAGFQRVLQNLESLFKGRIEMAEGRFVFVRGDARFGVSLVAEGIKKIGILTRLLENGQLRPGSILFLDEPETNLHPRAARALCRMLYDLAEAGVQIFLATHSYFVLKQIQLLARHAPGFAKLCSLKRSERGTTSSFFDLAEGLPDNEIVDESLDLYEEDLKATLEV